MIGKLTGVIDSFSENTLILDVQGVGYVIQASARTLSRIGQAGDRASLLVETQVREDAISLYGFADRAEKGWFRLLTGVQGVGPKAGLAILSVCPPDQLGFIIASEDRAALTRADGIGPKLATRILSELKDKAGDFEVSLSKNAAASSKAGAPESGAAGMQGSAERDAVSALANLGYGRADAFAAVSKAVQKAGEEGRDNLQTLLRLSLKELGG